MTPTPRHAPRIGLNLLYLVPGETGGTETYARMLIPALHALRPDWELLAFIGSGGISADEVRGLGAQPVTLPVPSTGRLLRVLGEQTILPAAARRHKLDLLHNFAMTGPRFCGVPQVTSTHDVMYATHPESHSAVMRAGQSVLVPIGANTAERVVTLSEASADEIVEHLGVPREKIAVVPIAARTPGPPTPEAELRSRLGLGDAPLILATSARRGHKNLGRLLEAVARLKADPAPALVLPGYATGAEDELLAQIESLGLKERVHLLGWIDDADLDGLYAASTLLAFPSLAEGFGLPVLEAMEHGLPVATSNTSSMPEVGGDAAVYFDPFSVDSIATTIDDLLADPARREQLAAAGRERAAEFSWERAAQLTIDAYEQVLGR
ncbi:MAG: glycosyltransferase family 4 protein [Thermoleophilaceae bacterium]|nr:glycosyltransferase family 4 protein [Thermoleophilaceae bacterium]